MTRVYRIGVQSVVQEDERFYLTLRNRTSNRKIEVPVETARRYFRAMRDG